MQHHSAFVRAQEHRVFAVVHGDLGDGDVFALFERLGEQGVGAAARFLGHHVIRRLEIDGIDVAGLHEFEDLHGLGGLRLDLLDLVGLDDDVFVLAELVALHDVGAVDDLAIRLTNVLLLEPRLVGAMEHVEGNAAAARTRKQAHGHGNESES